MPERTGASGVNQARRIGRLRSSARDCSAGDVLGRASGSETSVYETEHSVDGSPHPHKGRANLAKARALRIAWGGFGRCVAPSNAHTDPEEPTWKAGSAVVLILLVGAGFAGGNLVLSQFLGPQQPDAREIGALRVRHAGGRRRARAAVGQVLPRGDDLPAVRHRGGVPLSLGAGAPRPALGRASSRSSSSSRCCSTGFVYIWRKGVLDWSRRDE